MKTLEILDKVADGVLAYRPAPKSRAAKRRRKKAAAKKVKTQQ